MNMPVPHMNSPKFLAAPGDGQVETGVLSFDGRHVMAPLAGYTDQPFRRLVARWGVGLFSTEMISAKGLIHDRGKSIRLAASAEGVKPVAVQLFGTEPSDMAEGARIVLGEGLADVIDVNMGCPVRKVVKGGSGAALMREPSRAASIVSAVVAVAEPQGIPVTVKMRSGWDAASVNAPELAAMVAASGARAVYIHPRTKAQMFSGSPDWEVARRVRESVPGEVRVIPNGDIVDRPSLEKALKATGGRDAMIGRGCLGRPWIFAALSNPFATPAAGIGPLDGAGSDSPGVPANGVAALPDDEFIIWAAADALRLHAEYSVDFYGEKRGVTLLRKQAPWYVRGLRNAKPFRLAFNRVSTLRDAMAAIDEFFLPLREVCQCPLPVRAS